MSSGGFRKNIGKNEKTLKRGKVSVSPPSPHNLKPYLEFESGVHELDTNVLVIFPSFFRYPVVASRNNILVETSKSHGDTFISVMDYSEWNPKMTQITLLTD